MPMNWVSRLSNHAEDEHALEEIGAFTTSAVNATMEDPQAEDRAFIDTELGEGNRLRCCGIKRRR